MTINTIVLASLLLILAVPRANSQSSSLLAQVDSLIKDGLRNNMRLIRERSQQLSDVERFMLLRTHEKSAFGYALMNVYTGPFGFGSIIQGDPLGLVVAGLTTGLLTVGFSSGADPYALIYGGIYPIWLISWFLPSIYSSRYNSKLEEALNLRGISSVSLSPRVSLLANGAPSAGIMLGVGF